MEITDEVLGYEVDRTLAIRQYNRDQEDNRNQLELVNAHLRAVQLAVVGKKDESYMQPKKSKEFDLFGAEEKQESLEDIIKNKHKVLSQAEWTAQYVDKYTVIEE